MHFGAFSSVSKIFPGLRRKISGCCIENGECIAQKDAVGRNRPNASMFLQGNRRFEVGHG
jgi:hypothetical protein